MSSIYEKIGQQIRELRTKASLSQEAFAKELDIPPNTLSRWETGKYKPTAENLDQIARFFGVSITIFFPDQKMNDNRIQALTSAIGGLNEDDFQEVVRYAEFRRARIVLKKNSGKKNSN